MEIPELLLWLFVLNLGIAAGAGLYEARIVVPLWGKDLPTSLRELDTGRRFWVFVSTLPLTVLCLANLIFAFKSAGAIRTGWIAASLLILAERLTTFGYFIPTIVRLHSAADRQRSARVFGQWRRLNWFRNLIVLIAWAVALHVLTRFGTS